LFFILRLIASTRLFFQPPKFVSVFPIHDACCNAYTLPFLKEPHTADFLSVSNFSFFFIGLSPTTLRRDTFFFLAKRRCDERTGYPRTPRKVRCRSRSVFCPPVLDRPQSDALIGIYFRFSIVPSRGWRLFLAQLEGSSYFFLCVSLARKKWNGGTMIVPNLFVSFGLSALVFFFHFFLFLKPSLSPLSSGLAPLFLLQVRLF